MFSNLSLPPGCVKSPTWTHLRETAEAGATSIQLLESVNWMVKAIQDVIYKNIWLLSSV